MGKGSAVVALFFVQVLLLGQIAPSTQSRYLRTLRGGDDYRPDAAVRSFLKALVESRRALISEEDDFTKSTASFLDQLGRQLEYLLSLQHVQQQLPAVVDGSGERVPAVDEADVMTKGKFFFERFPKRYLDVMSGPPEPEQRRRSAPTTNNR